MPINPGKHKLRASAPGYREYTSEVEVGREKDAKRVEVPALQPLPAAPPPATDTTTGEAKAPSAATPGRAATGSVNASPIPKPSHDTKTKRVAAYVTAGSGLAFVGIGGVFGARALSKMSESDDQCPGGRCTKTGAERSVQANSAANVANVCVGVGLAAIGVGAYLFFTSSSPKNEQAARVLIAPTAGPGAGGLLLGAEL
jgi:hypothetical protein